MEISDKRKNYIRKKIKDEGIVQVNDLAVELSVSEMTIRRDLSDLEDHGFLKRTHGGAKRDVSRSYEPPFGVRKTIASGAKMGIGQKAASYVEEGDTIAVDSGTTALEFAKHLQPFRNLTVVTPSIHIASLFLGNPGIETILAGGIVRKKEGSLVGDITRKTFEGLFFDKFFMSTAALSVEAGYTEYILDDAEIKKLIISHSKNTIALMDSEKIGHTAFAKVGALNDAPILISDAYPDEKTKQSLREGGVTLDIIEYGGE